MSAESIGRPGADDVVPVLHPSPARDLLRLERLTPREALYAGRRLGQDVPIPYGQLGWGELAYDPEDPIGFYAGQRI